MSVRVRDNGNYHYRFRFKGVDYSGNTHTKVKRDAERVEKSIKEKLQKEYRHKLVFGDSGPAPMTLDEVAAAYITSRIQVKQSVMKKGKEADLRRIKYWLEQLGEETFIQDITATQVHKIKNGMYSGETSPSGLPIKDGGVRRVLETLITLLHFAKNEFAALDVVPGIIKPPKPKSRIRELEIFEEERLLNGIDEEGVNWIKPLIQMYLWTGGRRSEVLALEWSDVILEGENPRVFFKKESFIKNSKSRSVPLNSRAVNLLNEMKAVRIKEVGEKEFNTINEQIFLRPPHRVKRKDTWLQQGYVPILDLESEVELSCFRSDWKLIRAKAKLEGFVLHDLRHTFACRAARKGIDLRILQNYLGHEDYSQTMIYAHLSPGDLSVDMDKFS